MVMTGFACHLSLNCITKYNRHCSDVKKLIDLKRSITLYKLNHMSLGLRIILESLV